MCRRRPRWILVICLAVMIVGWYAATVEAQSCPHDGDVNQDGRLTPADALLAFQHFLGLAAPPLDACQQDHANVLEPASRSITPADALCIFRRFLGLPSCLETCADLAGAWHVAETVTVTCTVDGETASETLRGTSTIHIEQEGCNVHWTVPDFNVNRTGTIAGNTLQVSGLSVVPLVGNVTFTRNTFVGQALLNGDEFTLNGSGTAAGTADGIRFSCISTSTAVFTRLGEEDACADIAGIWSGPASETNCDGEADHGTWRAIFSSDCSVTIIEEEEGIVAGTIVDNVWTASIEDEECGTVSVYGIISGESISGTFTYSLGGGGTFSGNKSEDVSLFAGTYVGTFSGDDSGTFTVVIDTAGTVTGSGVSNEDGPFAITGTINSAGELELVAGTATTGATFSGTISSVGEVSGTWENRFFGQSGMFTGRRQ